LQAVRWWVVKNQKGSLTNEVDPEVPVYISFKVKAVKDFSHHLCPYCAREWSPAGEPRSDEQGLSVDKLLGLG
jgi:hypothetical protein